MIIKSLARYQGDLELRWLNGLYDHPEKGRRIKAQFVNHANQLTIFEELPFGMLPFLMPGLVVSRGEVQTARMGGKQYRLALSDLAAAEDMDVMEAIPRSLYSLGGHRGGEQRVLVYQAGAKTILIPAIEMIRFLFLHSRVLAEALLLPSGLMDLAVTPLPSLYPIVQIDFTSQMPRKLLTPEFVSEFSWLSIHPDGRQAWDSVRRRSQGKRFLTFDPPPLHRCRLGFRAIHWNGRLLVLEILSLSGRVLPAGIVRWTHPSECERGGEGTEGGGDHSRGDGASEGRPQHEREQVVDGDADSQKNSNQDTVLLGGKRGNFDNKAKVIKVLRPRRSAGLGDMGVETGEPRKTRPDAGQPVNPELPPVVVHQTVSAGAPGLSDWRPPVEFAMLEPAEWDHLGDLWLLDEVLRRIEAAYSDLTLTRWLVFLKRGKAVSFCGQRRRACLVAVFASPNNPPRLLLDVDHTDLNGLAGLLLRYNVPCLLAEVAGHVKLVLEALVNNQGHWDGAVEARLPEAITVQRLPKLLRIAEKAEDKEYVGRWVERLKRELMP